MKSDVVLGVDLGWVSQLESIGYCWLDERNEVVDPIVAAKRLGADTVRLRVFVDPPSYGFWVKPEKKVAEHKIPGGLVMLGFCDKDSVTAMSKRVKALNMKLMIDFHYSDHFADPVFQDIPKAWRNFDDCGLAEKVAEHTTDVLRALKDEGITPEYVQIGNEINNGLLLPQGSIKEHPKETVNILNSAYEAVKAVFPDTCVVTHVSVGHVLKYVRAFFDTYFAYGGYSDMIGLSYYPAWFEEKHDSEAFLEVLNEIHRLYNKDIILSEIGGRDSEEEETYCLLRDTLQLMDKTEGNALKGVIYWEPEANSAALPDEYPLGAARLVEKKTLQYTKALSAYKNYMEVYSVKESRGKP